MNNNPFCLTFGKEPDQNISRFMPFNEIISSFTSEMSPIQIFMITGVRGSGKTVFMNAVAKELRKDKDWVVIDLNSTGNLLQELAQKLYNEKGMSKGFSESGINLSFLGVSVELKKNEATDVNYEIAIEQMLNKLEKKNKRLLVAIDEVANTKDMKIFASAFQILVRHDLPIYLLMTGLYENINSLQNEKTLTFLYRAPKIYLKPLNLGSMCAIYEKSMNLSHEKALVLAQKSKGYSFAFQVIGYFCYNHQGNYEKAENEIRQYLDDYVYEKIWTELPEKEKLILQAIAKEGINDVGKIKEYLEFKPNELSVYRDRLIKKGILDGSVRGRLEIVLPYFDIYITEHSY